MAYSITILAEAIIIIIIIIIIIMNLTIEIQRMWNVKAKVIPVIIGATGTISNSNIRIVATQCYLGTWFVSGI